MKVMDLIRYLDVHENIRIVWAYTGVTNFTKVCDISTREYLSKIRSIECKSMSEQESHFAGLDKNCYLEVKVC